MIEVKKEHFHIYLTIIFGAISVLVNCFISLFITPRITNTIGIEAYGYVTLAKNFIAYATILTTALNSYAARYMSVAYLKGDKEKFNIYTSTVFIGDFIIGLVLFLVGIIFSINADHIINIDPVLIHDVKLLFVLIFLAFFFNTISTVYTSTGYIKDRIEMINIIRTCSYIAEIAILVFCFWIISPSIYYIGLSSLCMALFVFFGSYILTKKLLPESIISKKYYQNEALKELVINGLWNSANSLGNVLNSGLDLLVSNLMLTNTSMGQVSIAKTINNIIFALYSAISQAFQPKLLKHYSENNIEVLVHTLKYSMKVSGIITNCIFAEFIAIGYDFLSLWLPGQDINTIFHVTVITMMPCITEGCVYPLYYVYTLTVKNKIPCIVTIVGGLLNIVSMYFLLSYTGLGIYSIVITTAIIMNIIGFIINPLYISKCLGIKYWIFYLDIIFNIIMLLITLLLIINIKNYFINIIDSWVSLIIEAIILAVIAILAQTFLVIIYNKAMEKVKRIG